MKKHVLSTAIAAASLFGFSQASFALLPPTLPDVEVFMGGATAQDNLLETRVTSLCGADLHIFRDGADASGKGHRAFFCTIGGQKVLFHKLSVGGSAQGVNPLINDTPVAHMNIYNNNCTQIGTSNVYGCTVTGAAFANYGPIGTGTGANAGNPVVTNNLVMVASHAGASDVEPKLFVGPNTPSNDVAVVEANANAKLDVYSGGALVFGVPVSDNLYVALQKAQNLLAAPNGSGSCQPGAYTDACMPSLTKEMVATLISGQVKNWSEMWGDWDNNPATPSSNLVTVGSGVAYNDYDLNASGNLVITPRNSTPGDTKFHMCKRIDGSGTGAQMYVKFLNNPCSSAGLNPDWSTGLSGPIKHELSGSGDVDLCLEDFADGESNAKQHTPSAGVPDQFNTVVNPGNPPKTAWAVGVNSLEKNAGKAVAVNNVAGLPGTPTGWSHPKHYRFVKIDGVAPTLENVYKGKYFDWVEPTIQVRKNASVTIKNLVNSIAVGAASPAALGAFDATTSLYEFGLSGYLAAAKGNETLITETLNPLAPVSAYSHEIAGSLSNCQTPVIPSGVAKKPFRGL